jgi:xanthine dehydrogenase molybdopterin-binding subunit B
VEVEYEPLPPLLGIKEAIARGSFHTPPHTLARGDAGAALAKAPLRLEGEFSFGGQEHFYLETQAAWAEAGEGGSVFVSSSTQHPSEIQAIVAELVGEPRSKVVVQSPRMAASGARRPRATRSRRWWRLPRSRRAIRFASSSTGTWT